MTPRLVALSGPLQGRTVEIDRAEGVLGRDAAAFVVLAGAGVSRRHAELRSAGGRVWVRDLDSLNGTLVNGVPVGERELRSGDRVQVGDSVFLFLTGEETADADRTSFAAPVAASTVRLTLAESLYLHPERLVAEAAASASRRAGEHLQLLLGLGVALDEEGDRAALAEGALARLVAPLGFAVGALLAGDDPADLVLLSRYGEGARESKRSAAASDGDSGGDGAEDDTEDRLLTPSRELVDAAWNEGAAVAAESPPAVCLPLAVRGRTLGILWLAGGGVRVDRELLEVLAAAARLLAAALRDRGTIDELLADRRERLAESARHGLIGESAAMRRVLERVERLAPSDATVLLAGESGTGKELVARALHAGSARASGPFVAVNCAALQETLLESELFGHEKGAFTGAIAQKKGRVELAHGGTLFLDEIGELALPLQAKLLRVLQEREVERVGGTRALRVDVRVVAASHRDLAAAVAAGAFREDLYYRLNVVTVKLPPLRERREDVPLLARWFLAEVAAACKRPVAAISPTARRLLVAHSWPGNVRELRNAIEHAVVLGNGDTVLPEDLPESVREAAAPAGSDGASRGADEEAEREGSFHAELRARKKELIAQALAANEGNVTAAAKELGLHPNYLHRLMTSLGLRATAG